MTHYVISSGQTSAFIELFTGDTLSVLSGGVASSTTVDNGGSATVLAGGTAIGTTVSSGGVDMVFGTETNVHYFGGSVTVGAGGSAGNGSMSGGTIDVLSSGTTTLIAIANSVERVSAGGRTINTTLNGGGSLIVSGGSASATTVNSGGSIVVLSGGGTSGVASSTTVNGGSLTLINSVASSTTVNGGTLTLVDSVANLTAINGGSLTLSSGAIATSTTLNPGGSEIVLGGAAASSTQIFTGGTETVSSGGTTISTTIVSGGTLSLGSGALVSGGIVLSGGGDTIKIADPFGLTAPISGFTRSGDVIDLAGLAFSGGSGVLFNSATNVLTVTEGGNSATIQLDAENYSGIGWTAQSDGTGGTDVIPGQASTTAYQVTLPLMTNNNVNLLDYDQVINGQMTYNKIGAIGPEWELDGAGVGLLNGDGQPAFLMRNTGNVANGQLDIGEVVGGSAVFTGIGGVGPEWQFAGVGDLLGHGRADFLMRNTGNFANGQLTVGEVVNGSAVFTGIGGVGPEWQFAGVGDFLGDGRTGFLMRNTGAFAAGQITVGEVVNGAAVFTSLTAIGPEWEFKGVGDYLGVGHPGFLIRNTGTVTPGRLLVGEKTNAGFSFTDIGAVGPEWEFVGSGHYLSTASDDFLMRNTGNAANGLLEVGAISVGKASFTLVGAVGPEWNFHSTNVAVLP